MHRVHTGRLPRTPARLSRLAVLVAVGLALTALPGVLAAQATTATALKAATPRTGDYATDSFGDPWDFSNTADLDPATQFLSVETSKLRLQKKAGVSSLAATVTGNAAVTLVDAGPNVLPWGRNTHLHPIDADRYRRLTFRLYSAADMAGGVQYFTCADGPDSCFNGTPFSVQKGWHSYTIDLPRAAKYFPGRPGWGGRVMMLRFAFAAGRATEVQFDWVRLTTPSASATPVAGQSRSVPKPGGGVDYATSVRGRPWDLTKPGDGTPKDAANVSYSPSGLRARNTADGTPAGSDVSVVLALPAPLDGARFSQFSATLCLDGKFGLTGNPGGGMNGRVIWRIKGESFERNSQDFLVYPGCHAIQLDLSGRTSPVEDETDAGFPGGLRGFGHTITSLRFDPHEDPGARFFTLRNVRLTDGSTQRRAVPPTKESSTPRATSRPSASAAASPAPQVPVVPGVATPCEVQPGRSDPTGVAAEAIVLSPGSAVLASATPPVAVLLAGGYLLTTAIGPTGLTDRLRDLETRWSISLPPRTTATAQAPLVSCQAPVPLP